MLYIGIDPGRSGCIALVCDGELMEQVSLDQTEREIARQVDGVLVTDEHAYAALERVHAMPKQGVTSMFKFGQSYGACLMLVGALCVPTVEVAPRTWQTTLGCLSGGDKKVTKAKAQQLYPTVKVTHRNADALLLAEYARLYWRDR